MTVAQLMTQLQHLPPDATVELYHEVYAGGGDESRYDDPLVLIDDNMNVLLTADYFL